MVVFVVFVVSMLTYYFDDLTSNHRKARIVFVSVLYLQINSVLLKSHLTWNVTTLFSHFELIFGYGYGKYKTGSTFRSKCSFFTIIIILFQGNKKLSKFGPLCAHSILGNKLFVALMRFLIKTTYKHAIGR